MQVGHSYPHRLRVPPRACPLPLNLPPYTPTQVAGEQRDRGRPHPVPRRRGVFVHRSCARQHLQQARVRNSEARSPKPWRATPRTSACPKHHTMHPRYLNPTEARNPNPESLIAKREVESRNETTECRNRNAGTGSSSRGRQNASTSGCRSDLIAIQVLINCFSRNEIYYTNVLLLFL